MSDLGAIGIDASKTYFVPGFYVGGVVKDETGAFCSRPVILRSRPTIAIPSSAKSFSTVSHPVTGRFGFRVPSKQFDVNEYHYLLEVIPLPEETELNPIVFDHIIPT